MPRISIHDMCSECNDLICELHNQVNLIEDNLDAPSYMERNAYMMGYVIKRLNRLQKSLMKRIDSEFR